MIFRKAVRSRRRTPPLLPMILFCIVAITLTTPARADKPDNLTHDYYSILTTYACHAKSLWHDAPPGGYWGDGLDAKNQNGAVRGTANTLYVYAMLVKGMDERLLSRHDYKSLRHAGLSRENLIDYIRKDMAYLVAHHKSAPVAQSPQWGYHWQSSLWMGSLGTAALLTWNDLGPDLKKGLRRVAAAEADRIAGRKPKNGSAGNTAAEENAWDTHATAVALALAPDATSATLWWKTLQSYSANVYSRPADMARASGASGPAKDVITANIHNDFALLNHGFFHPDYIQVSGQHLGEAWAILALGDALHKTDMASQFEPYARFNVQPVWERILRPLLLPWGEFAYPAGNDWTFHCSTNQGYFAYLATAFGDPVAAEAEVRAIQHVMNRREAGPPGRLLGDSNLEWWWEPLVAKRCCAALLFHELLSDSKRNSASDSITIPDPHSLDNITTTVRLQGARVWWHRNPNYFVSVSWGNPQLGFFAPFGPNTTAHPYMTLPSKFDILPRGTTMTLEESTMSLPDVTAMVLRDDGQPVAALVCLPHSVVWVSLSGFNSILIENDSLTMPGRAIEFGQGDATVRREFKALSRAHKTTIPGRWLTVDDMFSMATDLPGFDYNPTCHWNMKSVAADKVIPPKNAHVWQMAAGKSEVAAELAANMECRVRINDNKTTALNITLKDIDPSHTYKLHFSESGLKISR